MKTGDLRLDEHRNLTGDVLIHARLFSSAFRIDHLVHEFSLERPTGYGFWVELPGKAELSGPLTGAAWWWLFDLSGIAGALVHGTAILEKDARLAGSRFTQHYRKVADGRAGPDREPNGIRIGKIPSSVH